MRVHVVRRQRSSLGRTGVLRAQHSYRIYLPGPYLLQVRRHHEHGMHESPPFPLPPTSHGFGTG